MQSLTLRMVSRVAERYKIIIFLVVIALSILVFFFYQKNYQSNISYLSGDEPHYIMMVDSFVKDGDFNLKNDYQLHRSTDYYQGPSLFPQLSPLTDERYPEWYPIHTVGLPLAIAPAYALFGVTGARIFLIAIQFSAAILFFLILRRYLSDSKQRQYLGLALLLICPIFWQNLGAIFPDLILVSMWGVMILLFGRTSLLNNSVLAILLVLVGLIHAKGLALMAPLVLFHVLWLIRKNGITIWAKRYWIPLLLFSAGTAASTYFLYTHYGALSPSQLYGDNGQLFTANPIINFIAVLTDRNKGLLIYFPVLLVVGPYLFRAARELFAIAKLVIKKHVKLSKEHFLLAGLTTGLTCLLITLLGFQDWSGSTAPNGRTMLPFVFVTIFLIAKYADFRNRLEMTILGLLGVLCVWLTWISIVDFQYYMSTGVNSFWVDRFQPLMHLPMFQLFILDDAKISAIRGAKILLGGLIFNLALIVIYNYKYKFTVRKRS